MKPPLPGEAPPNLSDKTLEAQAFVFLGERLGDNDWIDWHHWACFHIEPIEHES